MLKFAYDSQSDRLLDIFLHRWQHEIQPMGSYELKALSPEEKAIYEIFQIFYDPRHPSRTGGSEWGDGLYNRFPFFVVQNKIFYRIVDKPGEQLVFRTEEEYKKYRASLDSIDNFQPCLDFLPIKILYLKPDYELLLNKFLGAQLSGIGEGNIMNPAQAIGESKKRLTFLKKRINIIPGHWGFGWHLVTHPIVNRFELDKNLQIAYIEFRIVYEGGLAKFIRTTDGWKMTEAKRTWIE